MKNYKGTHIYFGPRGDGDTWKILDTQIHTKSNQDGKVNKDGTVAGWGFIVHLWYLPNNIYVQTGSSRYSRSDNDLTYRTRQQAVRAMVRWIKRWKAP